MKDKDGVVQIPRFYDKVEALTPEDRKAMADLPFDEIAYKSSLDVDAVHGEKGIVRLNGFADLHSMSMAYGVVEKGQNSTPLKQYQN